MADVEEPAIIPYAPAAKAGGRLFSRRHVVPAVLLLVLASAYWWGPPAWRRVQLQYWYSRCLAHAPPPGAAVQNLNYGRADWPDGLLAPYLPSEWTKFYAMLSPPGFRSGGSLFLGKRQTPNGKSMLVAVDLLTASPFASPSESQILTLQLRVFEEAGMTARPVQVVDARDRVFVGDVRKSRLFAGRPDPTDATHFTIPYATPDGQAGVIEGWLRNDGSVDFERDPPVIQRPLRSWERSRSTGQ